MHCTAFGSEESNQSTSQLRDYLEDYVVVLPFPRPFLPPPPLPSSPTPPPSLSRANICRPVSEQEHNSPLIFPRSRGMESRKAFRLLVIRVRDAGVGPVAVSIVLRVGDVTYVDKVEDG